MAKIIGNTTATPLMVDDKISLDSKNPIQNKAVAQELNKKIEFKGEIDAGLLPTENNNVGDIYKISGAKGYVLAECVFSETYNCYLFDRSILDLMTEEEYSTVDWDEVAMNGSGFDIVSLDVFSLEWEYIGSTTATYADGHGSITLHSTAVTDKMLPSETYCFTRSDNLIPHVTNLPIHSFETIADYAIYNGKNFDKFYTAKTIENKLNDDILHYKGESNEDLLPTDENHKGDTYKIEKYLISSKYVYKAWEADHDGDGVDEIISDGHGFDLYEDILASGEDRNDYSLVIPINIYDNSYTKIGTGELFYAGELPLWVFTKAVSLTLDETYYIERADGKIPADLEPTTFGYAIYNGESFDKFYNDETVDNKIAEVASAKADVPKPYEFIETVTLAEDVTEVNLSTEPDGTPYNFDKLLVYSIAQKATARDNLRLNVNGGYCGAVTNGLYNEWSSHSIFEVYGDKQVDKLVVRLGNYTNAWSNISNMNTSYVVNSKCNSIKNIRFFAYNVSIPAGTTFEIWGVRA